MSWERETRCLMTIPPAEATLLRRLEEELLNPEVRRSPDQVGDLLSDDFVEFGSSGGVFNKQQVIEALEQEGPSDPAIRLSLVVSRWVPLPIRITDSLRCTIPIALRRLCFGPATRPRPRRIRSLPRRVGHYSTIETVRPWQPS